MCARKRQIRCMLGRGQLLNIAQETPSDGAKSGSSDFGAEGVCATRLARAGWCGLIFVRIVRSFLCEDSWERSVVCVRRGDFLPLVVHGRGVDGGYDHRPALVARLFHLGELLLLAVWTPVGGPQIAHWSR